MFSGAITVAAVVALFLMREQKRPHTDVRS